MLFAFYLQQQTATSALQQFLPFIAIPLIFYFLVFQPMQRQKQQQKELLDGLQNGSEVVTTGGIVGTIVSVGDDMIVLRVRPDNIKLQVARSSVTGLVTAKESK